MPQLKKTQYVIILSSYGIFDGEIQFLAQ